MGLMGQLGEVCRTGQRRQALAARRFSGKTTMENGTRAMPGGIFEIEEVSATLVVIPVVDLRELDYQRIEAGAVEILDLLNGPRIKNVILDFHKTDYYESTALGFFLKLWKRVRGRNGRMAFCNVSDHELEILRVTKLDQWWPIYPSRSEALVAVGV
jgi:anti-anti-sigma factor